MIKKAVVLLSIVSMMGCASLPPNEYYGAEDPFSSQLDFYYIEKEKGLNWLQNSALVILGSVAGASIARTGISAGWVGAGVGNATILVGSALIAGGAVTGYLGYRKWEDGSENYIETLRLQSQYYNSEYAR